MLTMWEMKDDFKNKENLLLIGKDEETTTKEDETEEQVEKAGMISLTYRVVDFRSEHKNMKEFTYSLPN
ncbi:hypothetical protein Fmac_008771 [Flemingia macrophylla]|uniref:Uncharacterized protein n=1 Tax=Flemingia macrophylla TaxID=520843 RepID=A0ABD1MYW5_9FABA